MNTVVGFFKKYAAFIVMLIIAAILVAAGLYLWSTSEEEVRTLEAEIANVDNSIKNFNVQQYNVTHDIAHINFGLNTERWQKIDDKLALQWFQPAFSFKNSDEYATNRDKYVAMLGETDEFVTAFMPVYIATPTYFEIGSMATPDDGTHMSCKLKSFKSYVSKINEDTGVYSYVGIIDCELHIPYDNYKGWLRYEYPIDGIARNRFLATYDITADQKIQNVKIFIGIVESA